MLGRCGRRAIRLRYPSARALSRTLSSRVTIVTSCGASPSRSAVARCTASSVRIGSTGKRTSHASENVSVDIEDEAASLEGPQGTNGSLFLGWRQPSGGASG